MVPLWHTAPGRTDARNGGGRRRGPTQGAAAVADKPDIPDGGGMAHYRATVQSPAPAGQVFAYLADFATVAEWDPGVRSAHLVAGIPGQVGARYSVVVSNLGVAIPLEYEVLDAVPPTGAAPGRVVLEAETSDFRSYDVITVTPTGTGCEVEYDADLALKGVRRPFDPLLRVAFQVIGRRAEAGLATAVRLQAA